MIQFSQNVKYWPLKQWPKLFKHFILSEIGYTYIHRYSTFRHFLSKFRFWNLMIFGKTLKGYRKQKFEINKKKNIFKDLLMIIDNYNYF